MCVMTLSLCISLYTYLELQSKFILLPSFVRKSNQQCWLEHLGKEDNLRKKWLRLWVLTMRYFVITPVYFYILSIVFTPLGQLSDHCWVWPFVETHYSCSFQPNFTIWMHSWRSLHMEPGKINATFMPHLSIQSLSYRAAQLSTPQETYFLRMLVLLSILTNLQYLALFFSLLLLGSCHFCQWKSICTCWTWGENFHSWPGLYSRDFCDVLYIDLWDDKD